MTWNFRLVKHAQSKSVWYGVHEVFYNEAGKPWAMTQEPVDVAGESAKDILGDLNRIKQDLKRSSVLDVNKIKWAKPPKGMYGGRSKEFKTIKALINDLKK